MQAFYSILVGYTFVYFLNLGLVIKMHAFTEGAMGRWIRRTYIACRALVIPTMITYAALYVTNGLDPSALPMACFATLAIINEIHIHRHHHDPKTAIPDTQIMTRTSHALVFSSFIALAIGLGITAARIL